MTEQPSSTGHKWTQSEDNYLREAFRTVDIGEIARHLRRTQSAVYQRALNTLQLERIIHRSRGPRWDARDEELLKQSYGKTPTKQLAAALGRSTPSVHARASLLRFARTTTRRPNIPWTEVDERSLLANYGRSTLTEIASMLNRTPVAVRQRLYKPRWGVKPRVRHRSVWSTRDDELLRANYNRIPARSLARELNRTVPSVVNRAHTLGLTRHVDMGPRRVWTKSEDELLRSEYGKSRPAEIAKRLGRTRPSVYHRAKFLGFAVGRSSPEFRRRHSLPRSASPFPGFSNQLDVGYVAGIIDGEGSLTRPPHVTLQVSMTTQEVIKHLHRLCGGSVTGPYLYRSGRSEVCLPQYHWTVSSADNVYRILKVLLPYLIVKREKAEIVLQFLEKRWSD